MAIKKGRFHDQLNVETAFFAAVAVIVWLVPHETFKCLVLASFRIWIRACGIYRKNVSHGETRFKKHNFVYVLLVGKGVPKWNTALLQALF